MAIEELISWTAQIPFAVATAAPTVVGNTSILPTGNGLLVSNGSSLTHTLPAAGSLGNLKRVGIKNVHASAVTVNSAGGLIDGAASSTITTNGTKWFVTYGGNWYTVNG